MSDSALGDVEFGNFGQEFEGRIVGDDSAVDKVTFGPEERRCGAGSSSRLPHKLPDQYFKIFSSATDAYSNKLWPVRGG